MENAIRITLFVFLFFVHATKGNVQENQQSESIEQKCSNNHRLKNIIKTSMHEVLECNADHCPPCPQSEELVCLQKLYKAQSIQKEIIDKSIFRNVRLDGTEF